MSHFLQLVIELVLITFLLGYRDGANKITFLMTDLF